MKRTFLTFGAIGLLLAGWAGFAPVAHASGFVVVCDPTTLGNCIKVNSDGSVNTNTAASGSTTPAAGAAHAIVTGGSAVTFVTGPVKGCYIQNPLTATDENIAAAEPLYVNAVTTATTSSLNGSSTALQPGQSFNCIPGQSTSVSANALTSSHNAVVVVW